MKITVKLLKSLVYSYYQYLSLFFLLTSVSASANQNSASQLSNYHHTVLNSAPAVPNSANNAGFRGTGPNNVLQRTAGGNLGPAGFNIEVELGKLMNLFWIVLIAKTSKLVTKTNCQI